MRRSLPHDNRKRTPSNRAPEWLETGPTDCRCRDAQLAGGATDRPILSPFLADFARRERLICGLGRYRQRHSVRPILGGCRIWLCVLIVLHTQLVYTARA